MQVKTICCLFTFHLPTKEKDDLLCLTLPSTGDEYRTGEHAEGSVFETGHTSLLMLILMLSGFDHYNIANDRSNCSTYEVHVEQLLLSFTVREDALLMADIL